jgi:5-methylcytosine-specific restriction endonuclease McrA
LLVCVKCAHCGKPVQVRKSRANGDRYCSPECLAEHFKTKLLGSRNPHWKGGNHKVFCEWCRSEFPVFPSTVGLRRFCSRECRARWDMSKKRPRVPKQQALRLVRGPKVLVVCPECRTERFVESRPNRTPRMCRSCRMKPENNVMFQGKARQISCAKCGKTRRWYTHRNIAEPRFCLRCYTSSLTAENNPNWKGGITPLNRKIRQSPEYKQWRLAVFKRDLFTCQRCGRVGGCLRAHHIRPFCVDEESRLDPDNGKTLCEDCHRKTDTFLSKAKTWGKSRAQLSFRFVFDAHTTGLTI